MLKRSIGCLLLMGVLMLGIHDPVQVQAADGMAGMKSLKGHYYALFNDSMLWTQAKKTCERMGGHLVTVTSQAEQDLIKKLADEQGKKYYFWLGGTDAQQEGTWKWVTGERWDYEYWEDGQPNDAKGHDPIHGQDYLLAEHVPNTDLYDMTWDDQPNDGTSGDPYYYDPPYCQRKEYYGYICEWEDRAAVRTLKISDASAKLSQTKYTYSGDEIQPGVTVTLDGRKLKKGREYTLAYSGNIKVGTATVTVKGIGNYKGSIKKTFAIVPGKVISVKAKNTAKRKADLSWKRVPQASGYEIQYSLKRNFSSRSVRTIKKGTITKTKISSLSRGKTYYFRIRSYTKVKGKTYYGSWSSVKRMKCDR